MKKTQRKDALRNISKQFVSYISIVVISMLAVASFLAINFASDALIANASDYMKKLHFRDFEITSTLLLTEDDIAAIKNVEGVSDAEGVYQTSAKVLGEDNNMSIYVISPSKRISLPELRNGRMPQDASECAVEEEIMDQMGLHVGDTVQIGAVDGSCAPLMLRTEFHITGSFVHADHYTREAFSGGSRYVIVTNDAFDTKKLNGCYTKAVVMMDKPENMLLIGEDYDKLSARRADLLSQLAKKRTAMRDADIKAKYQKSIDNGQKKLTDAKKKLDNGQKKLDESAKKIAEGEQQLADAKKELDSSWEELETGRKQLDEANRKLKAGKKELDASEQKLRTSIRNLLAGTEYESNTEEYVQTIKSYLAKASVDETLEKLKQMAPDLEISSEDLEPLIGPARRYSEGLKKYNNGLSEYKKSQKQYQKGLKKYNDGMAQYRNGVKKLDNAKKQLAQGKKDYAKNLKKYEQGKKDLQKAKDALVALNACRWVVLNAECDSGYVHAKTSAENIRKLAMTFALLFVLVGMLVIYATVARIIDEQRQLVGTVKALGFYNHNVAAKYLLFGLSATFFGMLLGTTLSYFVLQRLILGSHEQFYVTQGIPLSFNVFLALATFGVSILLAFLSVWWAYADLVRHPAVELMKDKMPEQNVLSVRKKKSRSSLYYRLILRNIRMDIRRVFVTVISVAGCCTLLVIGFTLQFGISKAVDFQYRDILRHDHRVSFDPNVSETTADEIQALLEKNNVEYTKMYWNFVSFSVDREIAGGQLICGDKDEIAKNLKMTNPKTNQKVVPGDHGICLMRRIAEYYGVNVGDTITLYDDAIQPYDVKVEGIYQNFTGMGYVMSRKAYRNVFGKEVQDNCFLLRNCKDISGISDELMSIKGVTAIASNPVYYKTSMKAAEALRMLIIVMIVMAGVMAYFILLNLANMYINQKNRELTVMRINGFTTKEVISFVAGEAVVTTIVGILIGIAAGAGCGYMILRFVEHRGAGFYLTPNILGWLYSAGITVLYSIGIYTISLRKVKDLKLTDIA